MAAALAYDKSPDEAPAHLTQQHLMAAAKTAALMYESHEALA